MLPVKKVFSLGDVYDTIVVSSASQRLYPRVWGGIKVSVTGAGHKQEDTICIGFKSCLETHKLQTNRLKNVSLLVSHMYRRLSRSIGHKDSIQQMIGQNGWLW
jgi:hypothetical protein